MESAEIRRRFLRFFEERGHTVVPSASLIAADPTLLLVNAGMVPFKPYFLGQQTAPFPRAASVQKCVRTLDIDEVGKTTRHASFFQMCGNFSFGDYFKELAIPLAWELVTGPVDQGGYGLDPERLWITVYLDDDEAADIWHRQVGVPLDRIQRLGMTENYWSMGVPGPCGPCSEINYDRGPDYGEEGGPAVNGERYLEIWNLVFMQFERGPGSGKEDFPILGDLPKKSIDTGMGLERMAAVLQGVDNLYEIDTSRAILDRAGELTGRRYGADPDDDVRLRIVSDHARTAVMLVGDGVVPGNEGRGYVLRRIIRRSVRAMRLLGAHHPTFGELAEVGIAAMEAQYPELRTDHDRIRAACEAEERSFLQTLQTGSKLFDTWIAEHEPGLDRATVEVTKASGRHEEYAVGPSVPGDVAFKLHDTYGFPIDLTLEMAQEKGLTVDTDGFRRLMTEQRERAKADAKSRKAGAADVAAYRALLAEVGPSEFTGYDEVAGEARVRGLLVDGAPVQSAAAGTDVELVLDRTPFYAEGGGQLADEGVVQLANGALVEVRDVQAPVRGLIVHRARVVDGEVVLGESAEGIVDLERRLAISRAHTATHMVHKAFREALGEQATQMGSENSPGRLRFDFPSPSAVPSSVLDDVEQRVNEVLLGDLSVTADVMSQTEAVALGAMALFGEKYGDRVRVVSVGDWARELCGGTHMRHTGELGVVKLLGESSIGAGVRRVEALVGSDAYRFLAREHLLVHQLSEALKARPEELPERIDSLLTRLRDAERELDKVRAGQVLARAAEIATARTPVGGADGQGLVAELLPAGVRPADARTLALDVRGRTQSAGATVVVLGAPGDDGQIALVVASDAGAAAQGAGAGTVMSTLARALDGKGGGRDDVAQGSGRGSAADFEAAVAQVRAALAR
ncbi:MAG: alanine--tRNA ligase [Actinomycetes bacterium]